MRPQEICKAGILYIHIFSLLILYNQGTWKHILLSKMNMVESILKEVSKGLLFNGRLNLQHSLSLGRLVVSTWRLKDMLLRIFQYFLT